MLRRILLSLIRWSQRLMFLAGIACFAWLFVAWKDATFFQLYARTELQALRDDAHGPRDGLPALPASLRRIDSVVGVIELPRLAVSMVAVEGDDSRTLRVAAGHLPDTPLPWDEGNASFAGHRDTFFRALRDLRTGDEIAIETARGTFRYRVTLTRIVEPTDLSVLRPDDGTALTLITCYPFSFVGDAPQRFVVHAVRAEEMRSS